MKPSAAGARTDKWHLTIVMQPTQEDSKSNVSLATIV